MKRVLIFYSNFSPAFKAGGPVQSLVNLVNGLNDTFELYIFCSAYELGEKEFLQGIKPDSWNFYAPNVQVYYAANDTVSRINAVMRKITPDIIYINGIFLFWYNIVPLFLAKIHHRKVVVAPRGMFQKGALSIRPLKKQLFLALMKIVGSYKGVTWHATDDQEVEDVKKVFGNNISVALASNIPKALAQSNIAIEKISGGLKLVYLSLITEKKNLHLVLEALLLLKSPIEFHIYGPVKDERYWLKCKELMKGQIHNIQYLGPVNPNDVQLTMSKYHALILPTKGENFGHAIYEALSVGTPIIVSTYTPWGKVQNTKAGIALETFNARDWSRAIENFINMNQENYTVYSKGAYNLAKDYFLNNNFRCQYRSLFSDRQQ